MYYFVYDFITILNGLKNFGLCMLRIQSYSEPFWMFLQTRIIWSFNKSFGHLDDSLKRSERFLGFFVFCFFQLNSPSRLFFKIYFVKTSILTTCWKCCTMLDQLINLVLIGISSLDLGSFCVI